MGKSSSDTKSMQEKKETPDNGDGLGTLLSSFATSTTAHGVGRIAGSSDYKFKVSWFLVWLGVVIGFIFMVIKLSLLYKSKPVSTSISMSYEESLTFPGVTVCNLNMIHMSKVSSIKKSSVPIMEVNRTENTMKKDYFGSPSMANMNKSMLSEDAVSSKVLGILTDVNNLPLNTRMQVGYQPSEFIIYCTWAGLMCGKNSFFGSLYWRQSWNWRYGNCYTFNGYTKVNSKTVDPLVSTTSEGSEGLLLILDIDSKEYLPGLTVEEGIRVLIGDQDDSLFPVENGISIEPGVAASISIRKSIIEREDAYNNGSCKTTTNDNVKYSIKNCVANCKAAKQKELCNCTEVKYNEITTAKICETPSENMCMLRVNLNFTRKIFECGSTCPPPCKTTIFQKTVTRSKIFPHGYLQLHSKKSMSVNYVKENIIQLQIFFEDQTVQKISTGIYYKFDNLMSDVGGQLGLWIGVSAVTCMEFLALVWNMVMYLMYRRKKNKIEYNNT